MSHDHHVRSCDHHGMSCDPTRCVIETVRLHAPGMIIRKVTSAHKIGVRR